MVSSLPATQETWVQSLGREDPLEEGMATNSSILAWKIPWMEEPGRLPSMESQSRTWLSDFTFTFPFSLTFPATDTTTTTETFTKFLLGTWDCSVWSIWILVLSIVLWEGDTIVNSFICREKLNLERLVLQMVEPFCYPRQLSVTKLYFSDLKNLDFSLFN